MFVSNIPPKHAQNIQKLNVNTRRKKCLFFISRMGVHPFQLHKQHYKENQNYIIDRIKIRKFRVIKYNLNIDKSEQNENKGILKLNTAI